MTFPPSLFIADLDKKHFLHIIASVLVVLLTLSIPLSTTATVCIICAIILIWFIDKQGTAKWQFYLSYPLTKPIFCLIAITLIGMLYSASDAKTMTNAVFYISRLCYIPIFAYYIQNNNDKFKKLILFAFVGAMLVTVFCTFLKVYGHVPIGQRTYGHDVYKNHIVVSYFMATALVILGMWFSDYKQYRFLLLSAMGLIFYYLLFLNTGRTGFIVLYCGGVVYAWHKYRIKGVLLIGAILSLMLLIAYQTSDTFSMRVNDLYNEYQLYLQEDLPNSAENDSSLGRRIEFATNSFKLFLDSPFIGFGTGSFAQTYKDYFENDFQIMTNNPHNQYLKIAVEYGLIGLLALLWLFYKQWKAVQTLKGSELILAQALLLSFFIGCFFNTWLRDFTQCHFYCLMAALFVPCAMPLKLKTYDQPINHKNLLHQQTTSS